VAEEDLMSIHWLYAVPRGSCIPHLPALQRVRHVLAELQHHPTLLTHETECADIQLGIVEHRPNSIRQREESPSECQPDLLELDLLLLPPQDLEPI
jgi:hypothetical protein